MLNLVPVHKKSLGDISPLPLVAFTVDPDDQVVCAFEMDGIVEICVRNFHNGEEWQHFEQWPTESEILTIMADLDGVVCVLKNGDIVEVTSEGASILGGLDTPVLAAQWSSDQEVLCLVVANKILMLSRQFDMMGEFEFSADDLKLSKHVSVGWGKKETQFQGKGAHALRDPTMPEKVDSGILCDNDRGDIQISWRGDGMFVAVSAIESNRRVFRIFERDGTLFSVSEPCDYLDSLLSFQPRGAVIAAVQQTPHQIVFFEKNGLRRYEFALQDDTVLGLDWSSDSEVLAVRYASHVDLWTQKNYHWYRKSIISEPNLSTVSLMWHPVLPRTLLIQWNNSSIGTYSFVSSFAEHNGTVAVIDGDKILVTDLSKVVIPPPFSQRQVEVTGPTNVAVGDGKLAVATNSTIEVIGDSKTSVAVEGTPQLVAFSTTGLLGYTSSTEQGTQFVVEGQVPLASEIITLIPDFFQTQNGDIFTWSGAKVASFGRPCPRFVAANETKFFGLTRSNQLLYANSNGHTQTLGQGVTSIAVASPSLLLLTTMNYLKFVHLHTPELVIPEDDNDSEQVRMIERTSILVSVLPAQMSVVLEHSRGNLETVYPRMLVVNAVRQMIESMDYGQAFTVCRKHRVDLNLIYDYNTEQFEANLETIIEQIGSSDRIDLLISSLRDEDVTAGKYRATENTADSSDNKRPGKVNKVCDALLPYLETRSKLTALACKVPPQLETALELCQEEKDIRHLCFLTDADLLYNTALGMYDLKLALAVAQQAQKDPKEYLAFLRAREAEEENRRKFTIDDSLRRYASALSWLVVPGVADDDEVVTFVEAHELHTEALLLPVIDEISGRRERLLESQAELLLRQGEYAAAGLNYELIGDNHKAFSAYVRAGSWQRALSLDSTPSGLEEVSESLVRQEKWAAAAQVFHYYLRDPIQAISYYCKAFQFDEAVLCSNQKSELLERVDDGLREQFGSMQELFADCVAQINSQLRRLREVRAQRAQDMLGYGMAGLSVADDVSVAGTETTVAASYMTRYTDKTGGTAQTGASRRTQKNRRREERKKARGRKGTVYEEEYLVASTGRLIDRLIHTQPDAKLLAAGLKRRKMTVHYEELLSGFKQVLGLLEANVDEIYNVSDKDLERYNEDGELYMAPRPVCPTLPQMLV